MDIDELARAWRTRLAEEASELRGQAARARERARAAARVLVEDFGAREVWLFGSLAAEPKHARFDVDLAASGVRSDQHFAAMARVSEIVGRPVDLVSLETASPSLVRAIQRRGVRLDGR
jgi:predicted nucleotidyltransferase